MDIVYGAGLWAAVACLPALGYASLYLTLRAWGTLCVAAEGWHAGSVRLGSCEVVPAVRLFFAFQPLLRCEAAARRLARRRGGKSREPAVSEVVVELVSLI